MNVRAAAWPSFAYFVAATLALRVDTAEGAEAFGAVAKGAAVNVVAFATSACGAGREWEAEGRAVRVSGMQHAIIASRGDGAARIMVGKPPFDRPGEVAD